CSCSRSRSRSTNRRPGCARNPGDRRAKCLGGFSSRGSVWYPPGRRQGETLGILNWETAALGMEQAALACSALVAARLPAPALRLLSAPPRPIPRASEESLSEPYRSAPGLRRRLEEA